MDFAWSEEQQDVQELTRRILSDLVTDEAVKAVEAAGEPYLQSAWSALSEAELLGLALSEASGGAGMGEMELSILLREIGRAGAPLPAMSALILAALPLDHLGGDELHKRVPMALKPVPEMVGAWAEIATRDPLRPATTLTRSGDGYVLDGIKTHVEAAEGVKGFVVNAQLDGEPVLVVAPNGDGVHIERQEATNLTTVFEVRFEGVAIPQEHVLATGETARETIAWTLDRIWMAQASLMLGLADSALRLTSQHAVERKQFGQPIAMFQAVGQRAADAYIDLQRIELMVWRAAWRQAQGLPSTDAAQKAKYVAADGGHRIVATASHIHGGIGFDRDYPLYRYFLGMKLVEFSFGGARAQIAHIGKRLADNVNERSAP